MAISRGLKNSVATPAAPWPASVIKDSCVPMTTWTRLSVRSRPTVRFRSPNSIKGAHGFLGTVIGMVMAFDQIQSAGDISPTIVAAGMKVALITTIFGIIAAVILQVFYNYILTKIERLTSEMEDAAVTLFDALGKYKMKKG